ncbi:LamG-like jellyroll fold domain-containing protein [Mariniflexile litorale]|uniref:LamG-like jellyroll fold domain-containing protein n=1 Tax=Mariniflexile litorale TaxID=3045158 RepID=A0AAU7EKV7_9FLAO|nr:LamG-like jellyroll fold domain-containing protein [Mariniflexile sp. KMM 9835]MDQ8210600.1 hypothetical protein [Mariniflexile sp. KMM 9835]
MKRLILQTYLLFLCITFVSNSQNKQGDLNNTQNLEWLISSMINEKFDDIQVSGKPKIVSSPYGDAVYFNGVEDAFFLERLPIESMEEFTIEMIFNPSIDGDFEQRVVHLGEVSGDRMLLEIRAIDGNWYFDGFAASGENKLALIDEKLIHPLGKWYHVAFVVAKDSLSTYVNGKLELTEPFSFRPIETGQSSVGVRLNKRSWFKGNIYKIKISSKKLRPYDFMTFKL